MGEEIEKIICSAVFLFVILLYILCSIIANNPKAFRKWLIGDEEHTKIVSPFGGFWGWFKRWRARRKLRGNIIAFNKGVGEVDVKVIKHIKGNIITFEEFKNRH